MEQSIQYTMVVEGHPIDPSQHRVPYYILSQICLLLSITHNVLFKCFWFGERTPNSIIVAEKLPCSLIHQRMHDSGICHQPLWLPVSIGIILYDFCMAVAWCNLISFDMLTSLNIRSMFTGRYSNPSHVHGVSDID